MFKNKSIDEKKNEEKEGGGNSRWMKNRNRKDKETGRR
jgi:hypothetical protein